MDKSYTWNLWYILGGCLGAARAADAANWVALFVWRYCSNTTSFVFYGITCLIRRIEFAAVFVIYEERLSYRSSARQASPPELRPPPLAALGRHLLHLPGRGRSLILPGLSYSSWVVLIFLDGSIPPDKQPHCICFIFVWAESAARAR